MKAYAVLDGGGVKGAALAGCLKGAAELNIEFVGYGGTSAGSIVALLASVGYTPDELLAIMCDELNFNELLDDNGERLAKWIAVIDDLAQHTGTSLLMRGALSWLGSKGKVAELLSARGIYSGQRLEEKLKSFIVRKHRDLENKPEITFTDLIQRGCKPLRIVAANLETRRGVVMGDAAGPTQNVLTAVRASASYPLLFRPVMLHRAPLVDGGLASNLPVWLFNAERNRDGLPMIAFDLTTRRANGVVTEPGVKQFLTDMLETALEGSDALLRDASTRLMHVEVPIPSDIRTLDFKLSSVRRREIFNDGQRETQSYFIKRFGDPQAALSNPAGQLEAMYGDKTTFQTVLAGFATEIRSRFPQSGHVRCNAMLPHSSGDNLVVVYQHGMDSDPDVDLQLSRDAGPSGAAATNASPVIAEWDDIRSRPHLFHMTGPQINKVPASRKAVACTPIFDLRRTGSFEDNVIRRLNLAGVLSIDADCSPSVAGWMSPDGRPSVEFVEIMKRWADVVGRILN